MTATVTAVNQTQSLAAIRNFVRASVSCITYARGLCSDNAFEPRTFLGVPLRQLIPSTTESVMISEWIEKGAFDALNRKYLKEMSLCVYDADCQELLESYCFGFNYSGDGHRAQMTFNASQNVDGAANATLSASQGSAGAALTVPKYRRRRCTKQEVQQTLTSILERLMDVVETLPPLLSERVLTMRLTYYDDVTPATYEPPCFSPASQHMKRLYQAEVQYHVNIGSMDTCHHLFSVAIRHPLLQQGRSQLQTDSAAASIPDAAQTQDCDEEHEAGAAALGVAAAQPRSEPLRSGLQSTFSSEAATAARATVTEAANLPQQKPSADSTCDSSAAADRRNVVVDPPTVVGCGVETMRAQDVARLDGVYRLAEEPRPLTLAERAYLLFAALVFTSAPNARGGRGRLSESEVEVYRTQHCPYEVTAVTARLLVLRLASEGFLCKAEDAERPKAPRVSSRNAGAAQRPMDWVVSDPPAPVLQLLLQCEAVTQLMTHDSHLVLQELCVYLAREEVRQATTRKASQGRLSVTDGSRKRRQR